MVNVTLGLCQSLNNYLVHMSVFNFRGLFLVLLGCVHFPALSYDSLSLTIQKADSIFLRQNLSLLSQAYNINARDAEIIQARAYPNPNFSAQFNAIDPEHDRFFNVGQNGQKEFAIDQLLLIGGKRKSSIAIARQNKIIAQSELAELLRNLKLQLHSSFYLLNQYNTILYHYDLQLDLLDRIIKSYEVQAKKGNLPVKDVIRLKAVYLRISNNRIEVTNTQLDEIKRLQVLLQLQIYPMPVVSEASFVSFETLGTLEELTELALGNRPDFEISKQEMELASINLRLQKQLAIPDITLNSGYDQRGGAFKDQVNVGFVLPLPLWNRNRGNIKAASYNYTNSELYIRQKKSEIQAEVASAWQSMKVNITEYVKNSQLYTNDFTEVFEGVNDNFRKQNITIIEFVDFFEAYNESLADFQRVKTQLALSAEQINFVTASPVY